MMARMDDDLRQRCVRLLAELGLSGPGETCEMRPLTGGVASDVVRVDVSGKSYCIKFALEKLRVAADWRAPVRRSAAEYAWLSYAWRMAPDNAPRLYGFSQAENGFVMEFIDGANTVLWKDVLLHNTPEAAVADTVGSLLGRLHAGSTGADFDSDGLENGEDFDALRLDPYIRFTATRHPAVADRLTEAADALHAARIALIHGDVSPKNILLRDRRPILLDAECATMGDPCFDVAFCLNHLVLKSVHLPEHRSVLLGMVRGFWAAYEPHVTWEPVSDLEPRVAGLLPILMLARVDGKSPVEYLTEAERDLVRDLALALIRDDCHDIEDVVAAVGGKTRQ